MQKNKDLQFVGNARLVRNVMYLNLSLDKLNEAPVILSKDGKKKFINIRAIPKGKVIYGSTHAVIIPELEEPPGGEAT